MSLGTGLSLADNVYFGIPFYSAQTPFQWVNQLKYSMVSLRVNILYVSNTFYLFINFYFP